VRLACESCRELVVASFEVDGDVVRATCPACHAVMTAQVAAAAPADDAPLCPKCGALRRGEAACPGCGLAASRMAAFTDAREAAVPAPVRDAWDRVTAHWSDSAAHDELLQLVATHNCYAWAAGRYRTRRDAVAQRQLDRLRRTAEATLFASASARSDANSAPYRASRSVLAILIVAIVVGLLYATVIRDNPRSRAPAIPARPLTPGQPVSPSTISTPAPAPPSGDRAKPGGSEP
jgi:uncharacterized Zn finger protein (UPF0148 family)